MRPNSWRLAICSLVAACGQDITDGMGALDIVGDTIPTSLSGQPGNPERGRAVFSEREQGHCVICHQVEGLGVPFQGNVGPDLSGIGANLSASQLRLRIADMSEVTPDTIMPSYYRIEGLHQVAEQKRGSTILEAQQIEDLIAYLTTLQQEAEP